MGIRAKQQKRGKKNQRRKGVKDLSHHSKPSNSMVLCAKPIVEIRQMKHLNSAPLIVPVSDAEVASQLFNKIEQPSKRVLKRLQKSPSSAAVFQVNSRRNSSLVANYKTPRRAVVRGRTLVCSKKHPYEKREAKNRNVNNIVIHVNGFENKIPNMQDIRGQVNDGLSLMGGAKNSIGYLSYAKNSLLCFTSLAGLYKVGFCALSMVLIFYKLGLPLPPFISSFLPTTNVQVLQNTYNYFASKISTSKAEEIEERIMAKVNRILHDLDAKYENKFDVLNKIIEKNFGNIVGDKKEAPISSITKSTKFDLDTFNDSNYYASICGLALTLAIMSPSGVVGGIGALGAAAVPAMGKIAAEFAPMAGQIAFDFAMARAEQL